MNTLRKRAILLALAAFLPGPAPAQQPAQPAPPPAPDATPAARASSMTFLRFANLLPVGLPKVDVLRGGKPFLTGLKSGFMLLYDEIDGAGGPMTFEVRLGGRRIGDFKIDPAQRPGFFTAVVCSDAGQPRITCLSDNPPPPKPADPAATPPPARRLRGYFGGFDFPYEVDAGPLGKWAVHGRSVIIDIPVAGAVPDSIAVRYISRAGERIPVHFPIDFAAAPRNSIFVSQRGLQRPRVRCYPDNVEPRGESAAQPES
jgi:hypothetical protein